jgi:rSAM/selenodomain-associated transferase 2
MITVIIPVKNEEIKIERLLIKLKSFDRNLEILVVDGGSEDATVAIASKYAKVIATKPGRGHQLHLGTEYASGEIFWFVHADSLITKEAVDAILNIFAQKKNRNVIGGCLKLKFYDYETWYMKVLALTSNWRAKYLKLMFGDQGIFILKDAYHGLGGFKDMALMEDWEFSRRMSTYGKIKMLDVTIGTSGRRYKQGGFIRTLMSMHWIKILYILGYPPDQLAKKYREIRS